MDYSDDSNEEYEKENFFTRWGYKNIPEMIKKIENLRERFEWAQKDINSINQSFEMIRQENQDLENTVISLAKENTLLKMNLKMIQSSRSMLDFYDPMNPNTGEG
jgi:chromosome segregation ATPase